MATELIIHTLEQNSAAIATVHVYLLQNTTATYWELTEAYKPYSGIENWTDQMSLIFVC
jgi:hypothetical protein